MSEAEPDEKDLEGIREAFQDDDSCQEIYDPDSDRDMIQWARDHYFWDNDE